MILDILTLDSFQVELHLLSVVHHFQHIVERIAIVGNGSGQHNLEIKTANRLPVQVDIAGNGFLFLGDGKG